MSEISNYIPISRKIFEHQFWCEGRVYSRFEAWLDIVQSTRFEDAELLVGNRIINIKRGQLPVSLRYLADRWKWSTKKVNNYLDLLQHAQMVKKETLKETGQTLLNICNYDRYNFDFEERKHRKKHEVNSKETLRKQQGNKYNKDNNLKNIPPSIPPNGGFEEEKILNFYDLKLPDDGVNRNYKGLLCELNRLQCDNSDIKKIISMSNYGQIGNKVWKILKQITPAINIPGKFILKKLSEND